MNDLNDLLQLARPGGQQATVAVRRLIDLGPAVLARVVTAFEMEPLSSPGLAEVIRRNNSPEAIPTILDMVDSGSRELARVCMHALATSQDSNALQYLFDFVSDERRFEVRRSLAASALGAATGIEVQEVLKRVIDQQAEEASDEDDARFLLVAAIVALAQHGDQSRAQLLMEFASNPYSATQELAIRGMEVAVADGMIGVLAAVSRDPAPSTAKLAAKPLFLLGNTPSCDALHSMATSDNVDIHHNARIYLAQILGLEFTEWDELPQLEARWGDFRASMAEETCYRSGRPIQFPPLAVQFQHSGAAALRDSLADELQNRTGLDAPGALLVGSENDVTNAVTEMDLTEGALYRWGHRQDMPTN